MSARELIERMEKAEGPALMLDGMIWCAVNGYEFVQWDGAGCVYRKVDGPKWDQGIKHAQAREVLPYSASVDAAIALCEGVLPGWKKQFFEDYDGLWIARVSSPRRELHSTDYMRDRDSGGSPNGAIAIVIAILHALAAQEEAGRSVLQEERE